MTEPTTPPATSTMPILMSTLLRRYWAMAPETEEARIGIEPVPTATAGGNAHEDQERGQQEAAADAEQARQEAHGPAHAQEDRNVDGHLGYGQVDVHQSRSAPTLARTRVRCRARGSRRRRTACGRRRQPVDRLGAAFPDEARPSRSRAAGSKEKAAPQLCARLQSHECSDTMRCVKARRLANWALHLCVR